MTSTEERLGSENRYEGRWSLTSIVGEVPVPGSEVMVPGGKPMPCWPRSTARSISPDAVPAALWLRWGQKICTRACTDPDPIGVMVCRKTGS